MLKQIVAAIVIGAALMFSAPSYADAAVDLNTASKEQLETLPGIGPKKAEAIIAGRPYKTVEELDKVPGIGQKTMAQLKPLVTVESQQPPAVKQP